jgi:hypothetical protein
MHSLTNLKGVNWHVPISFLLVVMSLLTFTSSGATRDVLEPFANWPTTWIPLTGLNDANNGLSKSQLDFVGDTANLAGFYASTNEYVFFRQRVKVNTTSQSTFNDSHFVMINLLGTNYGNAAEMDDGAPDYAFAWDSFNNVDTDKHGLEMQVRGTNGATWGATSMNDIDGTSNSKGINDINGNSRKTDGYLRVISEQNTTNFGATTFIDYAVKWSYLKTYTGLNSNQSWKVTFASLDSGNDHSLILAGDIAGGASPASPLTNGWISVMSSPTGSEVIFQGSFFSFAMFSANNYWPSLAVNRHSLFNKP